MNNAPVVLEAPASRINPVSMLLAGRRSLATKCAYQADLRTLTIYDENRSDFQGEVTGLLSRLL